jgi:hypothetical protein
MAKDRRRSGQADRELQAGMAGTLCSRYQGTASDQPVDDIEGTAELAEKLWLTRFQDFPAGNREKF